MPFKFQNKQKIAEVQKLKDLADLNKKFVINLANENFTDAEYSVLGSGLKFVDIPKELKANFLDGDAQQFMRKMRIRYLMKITSSHEYARL